MDRKEILSKVDHTCLSPTATWADIKELCDDGVAYGVAGVCIAPTWVKEAVEYLDGKLPVFTVVGFPHGNTTTAVKAFEAKEAVENGAAEVDMVINQGWLKDKRYNDIIHEIKAVRDAIGYGKKIKVIVETGNLSTEEIEIMCRTVAVSTGDYIKTSTGFGPGGATPEDVDLMFHRVCAGVRVKASGGIRTFEQAEELLKKGAARLGTSALVKLAKEEG